MDASRVAVMGGSMGGTHTLWLTAIDRRVKAAVAVSAAQTVDSCWNLRMHCLWMGNTHTVKVIFIAVENLLAKQYNNLSNYGTNAGNVYAGWDVIESVSYTRNGKNITAPLMVIKDLMREHFPHILPTRGIVAIPLCLNPRAPEETVGISLGAKKSKITVRLADGSPFSDENHKCTFKVHCCLQVIREITHIQDGAPGVFKYTIENKVG